MICPKCDEPAHRSHARNLLESLIKRLTPYKIYRCRECGWRGYLAAERSALARGRRQARLVWIAGIVLALAIGLFAVAMLHAPVTSKRGAPTGR